MVSPTHSGKDLHPNACSACSTVGLSGQKLACDSTRHRHKKCAICCSITAAFALMGTIGFFMLEPLSKNGVVDPQVGSQKAFMLRNTGLSTPVNPKAMTPDNFVPQTTAIRPEPPIIDPAITGAIGDSELKRIRADMAELKDVFKAKKIGENSQVFKRAQPSLETTNAEKGTSNFAMYHAIFGLLSVLGIAASTRLVISAMQYRLRQSVPMMSTSTELTNPLDEENSAGSEFNTSNRVDVVNECHPQMCIEDQFGAEARQPAMDTRQAGLRGTPFQLPPVERRCLAPRCCLDTAVDDHMLTAISADGSISAKAIVTTNLADEALRLQGLSGLAAAALGRALTCSLLVAEGLKEDETFQVKFDGDGPLEGVLAVANGKLESRGYVGNPAATLPPNALGKFDVGGGVGKGVLQVVRTKCLPGETAASQYSSITELQSGEIPEDINYYLVASEQRKGALGAGVFVEPAKQAGFGFCVTASAGWYVQLLPFANEEAVSQVERNLKAIQSRSPTTLLRDGVDARGMIELLLEGLTPQYTSPQPVPGLAASCPCSDERVLRTLRLLPKSEIDDILAKDEVVEVKCEFCSTFYRLTAAEIRKRL